jgi:hypothetical protein
MRIQTAHDLDDVARHLVALVPLLDFGGLVYELLQVTPVFRNDQRRALGVVFEQVDDLGRVLSLYFVVILK